GQIYTSTDSGATWTARESSRSWRSIASSADGSKLAAVVSSGQIYTSTDSGATWTARESSRQWYAITSSADGSKLAAVVSGGQIYTSTDNGASWTARNSGTRSWRSVASSADGSKLAAVVSSGKIYTSISSISPYNLSVTAGSGPSTISGFASNISTGPELDAGQSLNFIVSNDNNAFFATQPTIDNDGNLTFTPSNTAAGLATVTVTAVDDGGTDYGGFDTSAPQTFTISVPEPLSFSHETYTVAQGASSVTLTVVRATAAAAASVTINTDDGTALDIPPYSPAIATGMPTTSDYLDLTGSAKTVNLAVGELSKTVTVTLYPQSGAQPNKRFTATLSDAALGLGVITTATVRILATDTTAPTLVVTAPAVGATVSTGSPYLINGTAGDARGIDRVEVSLNGGAPVNAVLGATTVPTSYPWSLNLTPAAGTNTVNVTAFDLKGNSTTVSRSFTFTQRFAVTLTRAVPTAVSASPDLAGTVALAVTPATNASALSPAIANPQSSSIVPGATVKLTATAKPGYLFSHWSGQPAGATVGGNVLTFTMPSANTPITATFVTVPTTTGGNEFYGLIRPDAPAVSSSATEGLLSTTFTPGTGALSGKVFIAGTTQSFTATAFGDGSVYFKVGAVFQPTLTFGTRTLGLTYSAVSGQLAITLSNSADGSTSSGIAKRTLYSATSTVPAALLNAGTKGNYTIAFAAKTQDPAIATNTYPQGDGYGTLALTNTGAVTLSGILADGSTVSGTSALVEGNSCPLYAQLVTPGQAATVKGGVFLGTLVFDTTQADSDVSATDLLWLRPDVTTLTPGSTAAAIAAADLYTAGWPEGITVDAVGALYDKNVDVATALDLGAASPTGNAKLTIADGKLTGTVTKTTFNIAPHATVVGTSVVTKVPTTDTSYTLTTAQNTGAVSGTFTPNWTNAAPSKPAFKGILLQKGANKGGFGYFLSNAVGDTDPESGGVTLSKQ
ncbi:MAG: InlB B-repeat-containing protein, partial [Roseimicrobium sp.]